MSDKTDLMVTETKLVASQPEPDMEVSVEPDNLLLEAAQQLHSEPSPPKQLYDSVAILLGFLEETAKHK